jgi:hypothetical protein
MIMTLAQIKKVVGSADAKVISAIASSDASLADLEEAWAWLQSDIPLINDAPLPKGKVFELIEILLPMHDEAS